MSSGLSFGRPGWAKDPGVSKPSSRIGGADNKGGGSAAASDGAHLVVSRQCSCLRSADNHCNRLLPSSGGHGFAVFNRNARVVVETWNGVVPGRLTTDGNESSKPFLCVRPSTYCAQRSAVRHECGHSESLPFFLEFLCDFSVAHCNTPSTLSCRLPQPTAVYPRITVLLSGAMRPRSLAA